MQLLSKQCEMRTHFCPCSYSICTLLPDLPPFSFFSSKWKYSPPMKGAATHPMYLCLYLIVKLFAFPGEVCLIEYLFLCDWTLHISIQVVRNRHGKKYPILFHDFTDLQWTLCLKRKKMRSQIIVYCQRYVVLNLTSDTLISETSKVPILEGASSDIGAMAVRDQCWGKKNYEL